MYSSMLQDKLRHRIYFLAKAEAGTHTHTLTSIYIYIYIYVHTFTVVGDMDFDASGKQACTCPLVPYLNLDREGRGDVK